MFQSKNTYYQLANAQLQVICSHHVISLRLIAHEGFFPPLQFKYLMPWASFDDVAF
jgi:hypothetical protein